MTNIEYVELGEVCEVVRGGSPRPIIDYITEDEDGVNWLKIGDVSETDKYFSHANEKIKPSGISKSRPVVAGDLILSNSMSFGRAFITLIDGYIHDGWLRLRCDESRIDKEYLYYFLTSDIAQNQFKAVATGSVVNNLKADTVKAAKIALPSLRTQKRIANVLSMLDKKIENNRAINRNLEEQARAVFTSWFVRFECFDEPMKESPIGFEIPESLDLVQIGDLNPVLETGRRPKGGAVSEGIPSIGAESVKGLGNVNLSSNKYIPIEFAAKQKTGKVNGYELMIYKDGGKPGEFHPHFSMFGEGYPFADFYINEHVFKLDFGNRGFNELAYFYFQTDYVMNWLESNGGKAAIPGINQNVVNSIWIVKPGHPKVKEYCEWVQPLFTQILKNCYSNMKLAELRDTLLPKLMSGELDVSDLDI